MPSPRDLPERALILRILDEAFDRNGWHGPTLRAALRGVTPTQASWKPGVDRHSVWELMLHCAYWKFVARRRLTGERGVPFPRSGRNYFTPPEPHERAWRDDVAMLGGQHHALRDAVLAVDAERLRKHARTLYGAAAHDAYHTGQIQLLKRLHGTSQAG